MSAQDLEQRAREILKTLPKPGPGRLMPPEDNGDYQRGHDEEDVLDFALDAIAAALRQQPAPVDLEQLNKAYAQGWIAAAEWAAEQHLISDIGSDAYTDERDTRLLSIIDNAGKVQGAQPVAWIRFRSDGGWEGPIHNCQIDEIRRSSGAWTPLYSAPHQPAPVVDDARMARALEWVRNIVALGFPVTSPEHLPAIEEAIAAYDPNCGARTVRMVDDTVRVDAERYRWLRNPTSDVGLVIDKVSGEVPYHEGTRTGGYATYEYRAGDELDAAIDAARAQGVQS